jgi:Ca2+-binding EF-hand superfamily protein
MIQDKIKELKEINKIIDSRNSGNISTEDIYTFLANYESHILRRDQIILEIEEELVKLNDFDNWKEWKNSIHL